MSKTRSITMRLDEELDERLKAAAERDRRPVAQLARKILRDALTPKPAEGAAA